MDDDDVVKMWERIRIINIINKLPSAHPEKRTEERTETHACDCISRQAILKAINNMVKECDSVYVTSALRNLEVIVADVPSAQPDLPIKEKCAFCPHCNNCDVNDDLSIQPCVDTISRQAAIDLLKQMRKDGDMVPWEGKDVFARIRKLPSVQPDVPDIYAGELISRQAAMEMLMAQNVIMDGSEYHNGFNAGVNRAQEVIRNLPPVQPDHNAEVSKMEIIRCKDCKYYGRADKRRFYRGSDCLNKRIDTIVPDRDFCSRAEKRGEADGSSNQV